MQCLPSVNAFQELQVGAYLGQFLHGPCTLNGLFERSHILLLSTSGFCVLLPTLLCWPSRLATRRSFLSELAVTCSSASGGWLACSVNL